MFNSFKFYIYILIFINLSLNALAQNLAYINLDSILENSVFGKKIYEKLKNDRQTKLNKIILKENDLKKIEDNILKKKNIISKEEYQNELLRLHSETKKLNLFKNELENNYDKIKNEEIMNFFSTINPFIEKYLNDNSIDILFNNKNIVIGKEKLDITEKIITIINKEIN